MARFEDLPQTASLLANPVPLVFRHEQYQLRISNSALSEAIRQIDRDYPIDGVEEAAQIYLTTIEPFVSPLAVIDPPVFSTEHLDELGRLLGKLGDIYASWLDDYRSGVSFLRVAQMHAARRSVKESLKRELDEVLFQFFIQQRDMADESNDLAGFIAALELASAHSVEPERSEFQGEADYLRFRNSQISDAAIDARKEVYWQALGWEASQKQSVPVQIEQPNDPPASSAQVLEVAEEPATTQRETTSASENVAIESPSQDANSSDDPLTVAVVSDDDEPSQESFSIEETAASLVTAEDTSADPAHEENSPAPQTSTSSAATPSSAKPPPPPPPLLPTGSNANGSHQTTRKSRRSWPLASAALLALIVIGWYWIQFGDNGGKEPTLAFSQSTVKTSTPRPRPTRRTTEPPTKIASATAIPTIPPTMRPTSPPETAIPAAIQTAPPTATPEMAGLPVPLISDQFDEPHVYSSIAGSAATVSYTEGMLAFNFSKPGFAVFRHIIAPEERTYRLSASCLKLQGANGGCLLIWLPARQNVGYQIVVTWSTDGLQAQVHQFLPGENQIGIAYSPSILIDPISLEADMSIIAENDEIQFVVDEQVLYRFPTSSLAPRSVGFGAFMTPEIDSVSGPISVAFNLFKLEASEQRPIENAT